MNEVTQEMIRNASALAASLNIPVRVPQLNWVRFEALVDQSGGPEACHPWLGNIAKDDGYGRFDMRIDYDRGEGGKKRYITVRAHRYALLGDAYHDPRFAGLQARHSCHFRPCCNRRHLLLGTAWDNAQDTVERFRKMYNGS